MPAAAFPRRCHKPDSATSPGWLARVDLNHRNDPAYQAGALTRLSYVPMCYDDSVVRCASDGTRTRVTG